MKQLGLLLTFAALAFAVACGGNNDEPVPTITPPTQSPTPPAEATSTPAPASPTPSGPAAPTATPQGPTPVPPSPTPQGSTSPFSFESNPDPAVDASTLVDVRIGEHDGYDRIVFEFESNRPEGLIEYVDDAAQCGSGFPVENLGGSGILMVRFQMTNAHTEQGQPTVDERELDGPGNSIAEARQICDFEALVEWVIGVEGGERPFDVHLMDSPHRVVIDIYTP